MAGLFFITVFLLLAVLAPFLGTDSSDASSESAHPSRGWWPAGPTATPRARF